MTTLEKLEYLLDLPSKPKPEFRVEGVRLGYRAQLYVTWLDNSNCTYRGFGHDGSVTTLDEAVNIIYDKVEEDLKDKVAFFNELGLYLAKGK